MFITYLLFMTIIDIATIATCVSMLIIVINLYQGTLRKIVIMQRKVDFLKSVITIIIDVSIEDIEKYLESKQDYRKKVSTKELYSEFLASYEQKDVGI